VGYANTDLKLNYARGVNYPSPVVLMNFVRTDAPVANAEQYWKNIKPEVVDHYEASLTHSWPKMATVGATVFRDKGTDRFLAYMSGTIPTQFNDHIGHYEIEGLELSGTVTPVKDLEFFSAANWLTTEAKGSNGAQKRPHSLHAGFNSSRGEVEIPQGLPDIRRHAAPSQLYQARSRKQHSQHTTPREG
jgi:iron complex outermembrane receptor protein